MGDGRGAAGDVEAREYAVARRLRVASRHARHLGSRVAIVGDLPAPRSVRPLVVCHACPTCPPAPGAGVIAIASAIPVLSGALTGVLLATRLDGAAAAALRECARLLQPGGGVVAIGELPGVAARRGFEAAATGAGFDAVLCTPVGPLPARPRTVRALWGIAAVLDHLSVRVGVGAGRPVEAAFHLRRVGGDRCELPGFGGMLREMVVPGGLRPRRR